MSQMPHENVVMCLIILTICYLQKQSIISKKTTFGIECILYCSLLTSGFMFNQIRLPPFLGMNEKDEFVYIYNAIRMQFRVEAVIIGALSAAVTAGMIVMTEAARRTYLEAATRKYLALGGLAAVAICFSLELSIMKSKYSHYPYTFLFN